MRSPRCSCPGAPRGAPLTVLPQCSFRGCLEKGAARQPCAHPLPCVSVPAPAPHSPTSLSLSFQKSQSWYNVSTLFLFSWARAGRAGHGGGWAAEKTGVWATAELGLGGPPTPARPCGSCGSGSERLVLGQAGLVHRIVSLLQAWGQQPLSPNTPAVGRGVWHRCRGGHHPLPAKAAAGHGLPGSALLLAASVSGGPGVSLPSRGSGCQPLPCLSASYPAPPRSSGPPGPCPLVPDNSSVCCVLAPRLCSLSPAA